MSQKFSIILFESALELIPSEMRNDKIVAKKWKEKIKDNTGILLDGAIHRPLLAKIDNNHKRGRPDIIHSSLLNIVFSRLFTEKQLEVVIHTRNDIIIELPSDWRIPVNYNRFSGLMAQLLIKGQVPVKGEPILTTRKAKLSSLLKSYKEAQMFLCDETSSSYVYNTSDLKKTISETPEKKEIVFLVGGFQSGQPESLVIQEMISKNKITPISLYNSMRPTWNICGKIINLLEELTGLY